MIQRHWYNNKEIGCRDINGMNFQAKFISKFYYKYLTQSNADGAY